MIGNNNNGVQVLAKWWSLFFWASSISMILLIAIASCTSAQTFSDIYNLVAEFLFLDRTSISLRSSPGLGHFLCYTLLGFSLSGVFPRRFTFVAPLVAGFFGVFMEFVQISIPSRYASLMDTGITFLGAGIGFWVYKLWVTYAVRPHSN